MDTRFNLTLKFGLGLSKEEPNLYIQLISKQGLTDNQKEKLSAILLQVPKHAMAQAASLVTDNWIRRSEQRRQSFYNLAFLLQLETLFTFTTTQEMSEFNGMSTFLYKLDYELQ